MDSLDDDDILEKLGELEFKHEYKKNFYYWGRRFYR